MSAISFIPWLGWLVCLFTAVSSYKEGTCLQPAETGNCRGAMPRFFYNWRTKKCEEFTYGGCDGNENRFESKETCQKVCQDRKLTKKERCSLPSESGLNGRRCKAFHIRYTYDRLDGKCVRTQFGGCYGTENLFEKKTRCEKACSGLPECPKPKEKPPKDCYYYRTSYVDGAEDFCGKIMTECPN